MSIQEKKLGEEITPLSHFNHSEQTEENRQAFRKVLFGETANYPAIQKATKILDGDYSFSSTDMKVPNRGS